MVAKSRFNPEDLAHWYFRLNGFMTIPNFVLHPRKSRGDQRTDVDIFGVRFPNHRELNYRDDQRFSDAGKPYFVIAEVKSGLCVLNGPWKKPEIGNMQDVLRAIGDCRPEMIDNVAKALYDEQRYEDDARIVQIVGVGERLNVDRASIDRPLVQISFQEICCFIIRRFQQCWWQKRNHQQWDEAGHFLYEASGNRHSESAFIEEVYPRFGLNIPKMIPPA